MDIEKLELDAEFVPGSEGSPELQLLVAIIERVFLDLYDERYREEAKAFFWSTGFRLYCDWLGWDAESVRQRVFQKEFTPTV